MPPLVRIFYISAIVPPLTDVDVQIILGTAQLRNRRVDVTGLLAQSRGHFAQVLEGKREAVEATLARIVKDPHHRAVRILLDLCIECRRFDRWAMAWVWRDELANEMRQLHEGSEVDADAAGAMIDMLPLPH